MPSQTDMERLSLSIDDCGSSLSFSTSRKDSDDDSFCDVGKSFIAFAKDCDTPDVSKANAVIIGVGSMEMRSTVMGTLDLSPCVMGVRGGAGVAITVCIGLVGATGVFTTGVLMVGVITTGSTGFGAAPRPMVPPPTPAELNA